MAIETPLQSISTFLTPWHICVHGLGLGVVECRRPGPGVLEKLLGLAEAIAVREGDGGRILVQLLAALKNAIVSGSPQESYATELAVRIRKQLRLISDPVTHAWLSAQSVECLSKLVPCGLRPILLSEMLRSAFVGLAEGTRKSDLHEYDKAMAGVQLLWAAKSIGGYDCFVNRGSTSPFVEWLLQASEQLRDPFYRVRCSATLYSVLADAGYGGRIPGLRSHVQRLLAFLDEAVKQGWHRPEDEIHSSSDYLMFSLALLLTAVSALDDDTLSSSQRHWIELAEISYRSLSVPSKTSQFSFYEKALRSLKTPIEEVRREFMRRLHEYLSFKSDRRPDAYLRFSYLVFTAKSLSCLDLISSFTWERISESMMQALQQPQPDSKYFNREMVIAYALATLKFDPERLAGFVENPTFADAVRRIGLLDGRYGDHKARVLSNALLDLFLGWLQTSTEVESVSHSEAAVN